MQRTTAAVLIAIMLLAALAVPVVAQSYQVVCTVTTPDGAFASLHCERVAASPTPTPEPTAVPTDTPTPEPSPTAPQSPLPTPTQPTSPLPEPTATATGVAFVPPGQPIASNADDVHEWRNGIQYSAWPAWTGYWDGASEQIGYRFTNVDVSGPIGQATLWIYGTHASSNDLLTEVYGVAADDAPGFAAGGSLLALPTTEASTLLSTVTAGQWHAIDVSQQMREITSRPGWRAGNAIGLLLINGQKARNQVSGVVDYIASPAQAARLEVAPLDVQAAAVPEPPATFGRHSIEAALAASGLELEPGRYFCEGDPYRDEYTDCKLYYDDYTICASGSPLELTRCAGPTTPGRAGNDDGD